ncbi:hypothetical protein DPMN_169317 [Dreissena polymorpha]|uniref:C2H2-type domain-containing protein n=1 Tax=Dreissena polymorpha TaxID=45954 RepID=A0A9D4IWQ8_DREPO|nr:hypothetical protein DPMN_169317 [Dreissena polymorpha]
MESSKGDQIQCEVCGVALSCAYSLKRHMQLHSDSTYECDFPECGKTSLQRQTRSHTDGPKVCSQCGKEFTTTYWLNKHENEIHLGNASKYSCTVCAKPCQLGYALQQHLSSHSDENKYTCEICSKSYKTPSILRINKCSPLDDREGKHACATCTKTFKTRRLLKQHMHKHDAPKFSCHVCGKMFKWKHCMKNHIKQCGVEINQG